jgi:endonuclease YncB( thermonuclease family)
MDYQIELYDNWNRRIAVFDDVPLLDAIRRGPDQRDEVRGMLPRGVLPLAPAYRVRVLIEGEVFCDAPVEITMPQWGDMRKLILDQYVSFREVVEFHAATPMRRGNTAVARAWTNREISAIAREAINHAPGPIHYYVDHTACPDGAQREYAKFLARKTDENELETGGIASGQWIGAERLDLSGAYAKDGDTISGVVADGEAWPDIRLMLIDAEETSRNSHAVSRHPEVADWSDARYNASGYKRRADAATAFLQALIDTKGIDYIELNPHRDASGAFDDRIDAYGRYIGLVYGGGESFNAAMVEQDLADVYLYEDGRYHLPSMQLKDFFSYRGAHTDSIETSGAHLRKYDVRGGVLEILTALAAAADGFVFSVDTDLGVTFRRGDHIDRVVVYDPGRMGAQLGFDSGGMRNYIVLRGNPVTGMISKGYARGESIDAYGLRSTVFEYFSVSTENDADLLAEGLLNDAGWPAPVSMIWFFGGEPGLQPGMLIEVRGEPLRRFAPETGAEWKGWFAGKLIGRIAETAHRFTGREVVTTIRLTSPLRSVEAPLSFIVRGQEAASELYEFRLDDATSGLDMGFHLD